MDIRPAKQNDLEALYAISLSTGDQGSDARQMYDDPRLVGHIYAAPYLRLQPETCVVVEDDLGVAGYAVGAVSTRTFEQHLEKDWWPALRAAYAAPDPDERIRWTQDDERIHAIHCPHPTPDAIVADFPAHLHLNLLPRLQGRDVGALLLNAWLKKAQNLAVAAVHVGVHSQNARGLRFWKGNGFSAIHAAPPPSSGRSVWLGRAL